MIRSTLIYWIECTTPGCGKKLNGAWPTIESAEHYAAQASWSVLASASELSSPMQPLPIIKEHYCPRCVEAQQEDTAMQERANRRVLSLMTGVLPQ